MLIIGKMIELCTYYAVGYAHIFNCGDFEFCLLTLPLNECLSLFISIQKYTRGNLVYVFSFIAFKLKNYK